MIDLEKFNAALDKQYISTLCYLYGQNAQFLKWYY